MNRSEINLDITHRCLLQCPKCQRNKFPGLHKRGHDLDIDDFQKIVDYFPKIIFFCPRSLGPALGQIINETLPYIYIYIVVVFHNEE